MLCPETPVEDDWVSESESWMIPTPKSPPSPSFDAKPSEDGHPQKSLSQMACPIPASSRLSHGAYALSWTQTWSGSIAGQSRVLCISGVIASSAKGRTNTITGFSSTLLGSELREFGATILDSLVQSADLSFEECPICEWHWTWAGVL